MQKIGARMKQNGMDLSVAAWLFANDTVLLAESERELHRVVDNFHSVCRRRKLRVNAGKSKVDERCEIVMGGERMEVVKQFKYLGTVLSML